MSSPSKPKPATTTTTTTTPSTAAAPKKPKSDVPVGAILGLGNPLLDISAEVPLELLNKYGLKTNNAILAEEKHLPLYGELEKEHAVSYIAGGATQNSIRVAQWMLRVPGATAYVGSVGKSCRYADALRDAARADGVSTLYYEAEGHVTGTCAVLVHDKDRSLVANLAAANHFAFEHMQEPDVRAAMDRARIFYSAGFFLTVPTGPATSKHVARHAAEQGKIYALNVAAPFIAQFFTEPLMDMVHFADYVFANESEALALAVKLQWAKEGDAFDIKAAALRLAALPKASGTRARTVVFTQGAHATVVAADGATLEFPVVPLPKEKIVDTNGAGDAFVGGFLSQLAQGAALERCVLAGHAASRVVIPQPGCTVPAGEPPSF